MTTNEKAPLLMIDYTRMHRPATFLDRDDEGTANGYLREMARKGDELKLATKQMAKKREPQSLSPAAPSLEALASSEAGLPGVSL